MALSHILNIEQKVDVNIEKKKKKKKKKKNSKILH